MASRWLRLQIGFRPSLTPITSSTAGPASVSRLSRTSRSGISQPLQRFGVFSNTIIRQMLEAFITGTTICSASPLGSCQPPVDVRFVEGQPLVLRHISATAGPASGLLPGDLIEQLDARQSGMGCHQQLFKNYSCSRPSVGVETLLTQGGENVSAIKRS
jgi:hypothetical protein